MVEAFNYTWAYEQINPERKACSESFIACADSKKVSEPDIDISFSEPGSCSKEKQQRIECTDKNSDLKASDFLFYLDLYTAPRVNNSPFLATDERISVEDLKKADFNKNGTLEDSDIEQMSTHTLKRAVLDFKIKAEPVATVLDLKVYLKKHAPGLYEAAYPNDTN